MTDFVFIALPVFSPKVASILDALAAKYYGNKPHYMDIATERLSVYTAAGPSITVLSAINHQHPPLKNVHQFFYVPSDNPMNMGVDFKVMLDAAGITARSGDLHELHSESPAGYAFYVEVDKKGRIVPLGFRLTFATPAFLAVLTGAPPP
jgi:hypothetical protein